MGFTSGNWSMAIRYRTIFVWIKVVFLLLPVYGIDEKVMERHWIVAVLSSCQLMR